MSEDKVSKLSDAEKARIERNRQKALHLRQAKLVSHPYAKIETNVADNAVIKVQGTKFIDSGGGFLIEESTLQGGSGKKPENNKDGGALAGPGASNSEEALAIPITFQECLECADNFADSYLLANFNYAVCDKCRDPDDKHSLITKTEAKQTYLLKDCDLDKREPVLKFITRKNPHHVRWGEMKLYLHLQIEQRALEIWGTEEALQQEIEVRQEKRDVSKVKKYNKKLKQLRMDVRSSIYNKVSTSSHIHEFGPDEYNEDDDTYTHTCLNCPYSETFEKM